MIKKSFSYKVAKKSIICAITVILVIQISILTRLGPSTHKIDEFGEDLRLRKSHYMDAGPREKNILNCRNTDTNGIKKLILSAYDKRLCPLFGISGEILIDGKRSKESNRTFQYKKATTQSSGIALGQRIQDPKLFLEEAYSIFLCFSAFVLCETKISEKSPVVKRRMCQNVYHDLIVSVYYDGRIYVDSDSCFNNIDKWNELATYWNQEPPLAGDLVLIFSGHLLLLDVISQILDQLQVLATLYFKTDVIFLYKIISFASPTVGPKII